MIVLLQELGDDLTSFRRAHDAIDEHALRAERALRIGPGTSGRACGEFGASTPPTTPRPIRDQDPHRPELRPSTPASRSSQAAASLNVIRCPPSCTFSSAA